MRPPQIKKIKTISEFHRLRGLQRPEHPLISVIDYSEIVRPDDISETNWAFEFYHISVKRGINAKMKYGQNQYDFDEGVMFFIAPDQIFKIAPEPIKTQSSGWVLLIHPDFIWNTPLAKNIRQYDYFDYSVNEALFLSEKEETLVGEIFENIKQEYHGNIDKFSQNIIISHIETLLNYSERFYNRQFLTRKKANHQILERLEALLDDYFNNEYLASQGLPTVQYIAESLNISQKYLSNLLKVLTGQSTQQHIHDRLILKAKELLSMTELSISEIAYELGFEHLQSFSKLFKLKTNVSPLAFRQSFN